MGIFSLALHVSACLPQEATYSAITEAVKLCSEAYGMGTLKMCL